MGADHPSTCPDSIAAKVSAFNSFHTTSWEAKIRSGRAESDCPNAVQPKFLSGTIKAIDSRRMGGIHGKPATTVLPTISLHQGGGFIMGRAIANHREFLQTAH